MMRKCQNDPEYKKMIESKMRTTLFAKQHEKVVQELTEASRAKAIADGILQPDVRYGQAMVNLVADF